MEVRFQVVSKETGRELGPVRELLSEALSDRRQLVEPRKAEISRLRVRPHRGGMSEPERRARISAYGARGRS